MKQPLLFALALGIPLEAVNFCFCMPPIDVGIPSETGWIGRLLFWRWIILHWVGPKAAMWFSGQQNCSWWWIPIGGYVEVTLLLYGALLIRRWIRHRATKTAAG